METLMVTRSQVRRLEVTEMKMCVLVRGHTLHTPRDNDVRNDDITEMCRKSRYGWLEHVKR